MKETLKLITVLTVICLVAGGVLAWVYEMTKGPIEATERAVKAKAVLKVLPLCDNNPLADTVTINDTWTFYVATKDGAFVGTAFESVSALGYAGNIGVMVGIDANDKLCAIEILPGHKETPGLGARITEDAFKNRFRGRPLSSTTWAVTKDQGDIDQITAATISSRAVVEAVKNGVEVYLKNKEAIRARSSAPKKETSE